MQIPIVKSDRYDNLLMIELQGKIEIFNSHLQPKLGELVGDKLYIGNHILDGVQVELSKPLLVMNKQFKVISVIRHKILFKNRPSIVV